MSESTKDLKAKWQDAEDEAIRLQNEKDDAIDKVRAKYTKRLRTAVDKAAKAQKVYLDAEAADELRSRLKAVPDDDNPEHRQIVAANEAVRTQAQALGLTL